MMADSDLRDINGVLMGYAKRYLTYSEMSGMLLKSTGIKLSVDAIRKRLKRRGFPSRRGPTKHSASELKMVIEECIPEQTITAGYRYMTDFLRKEGMHIRRDDVMKVMRQVDLGGVAFRRRRRLRRRIYSSMGPNHVWHVDGYDKLKPYGFPIHGCIDAFSRKVMWLNVGATNNDPKQVSNYFVNCVKEVMGCPLVLQVDPGTENSYIGAIQCTLRHNAKDCFAGSASFRVVKSTFNQRIEAWWSILRRYKMDWWIQFFRDLESFGLFCRGNRAHILSIRYCFQPLIQNELDKLVDQWNNHYVSHSRQASCPHGRPIVLYNLPSSTGAVNCIHSITNEDLEWLNSMFVETSVTGCADFDNFARNQFNINHWETATDWTEALNQYINMLQFTM